MLDTDDPRLRQSLKETSLNARGELLHITEKPNIICPNQAVVIAHNQLVQTQGFYEKYKTYSTPEAVFDA